MTKLFAESADCTLRLYDAELDGFAEAVRFIVECIFVFDAKKFPSFSS
jgi:hypothetical protein